MLGHRRPGTAAAGIAAGTTWTAEATVLQHGRNPLPDATTARPTVTIVNVDSGERKTFVARSTADPEVFRADVVFPAAGTWRYEAYDDFSSWEGEPAPCAQTHTFAAVTVGGSAGGSTDFPVWPVAGGVLALLAALAASAALLRRHRGEATA